MPIIDNAYLYYAKIQKPGRKFESEETEWSVDACVDKETAKAWSKAHKKQPHKVFDNDDFERIFKTPPPFPGDEQYVIKVRRKTHYRDKEGELQPVPESANPRVYDSEKNDITDDTLVGNGSKGAVAYEIYENGYGQFGRLKAIRVDTLVPYEGGGGGGVDELFGGKPKASGAKPKRATPAPAANPESDDPF